jgi:hypothetical protein
VVSKGGQQRLRLCPAVSYESVGVWRDTNNTPCLVVQARFADGGKKMLMLYESACMEVSSSVRNLKHLPPCVEGQWCILPAP